MDTIMMSYVLKDTIMMSCISRDINITSRVSVDTIMKLFWYTITS